MYFLTKNRSILVKVMALFLLFHVTLFASSSQRDVGSETNSYMNELTCSSGSLMNQEQDEHMEVALDSFGSMSMTVMLILTSLLGAFFFRNDLNVSLE